MRTTLALAGTVAVALSAGCGPTFGPKARFGLVIYAPGAGHMDFGDIGIRKGLEEAGFKGQVATYTWTIAPLNPVLDQELRLNARLRATGLTRVIQRYLKEYPGRPIHLIGLSAGSGIVIWAVEGLEDDQKVDNVVLLASSLWHRYDVSKALPHIRGKIYNFYSPEDPILGAPVKVFGTIDGKFGQDAAGAVGLHPPKGSDRVVNIAWRPEFKKYGYYGGHTDATSPRFVRQFIAPRLLELQPRPRPVVGGPVATLQTAPTTPQAAGPAVAADR